MGRGDDQRFHTVINSENSHAREAALYTRQGQVDASFLDPAYNTGAPDWEYNNDYVDGNDRIRNS